jgi:hypothetical protein
MGETDFNVTAGQVTPARPDLAVGRKVWAALAGRPYGTGPAVWRAEPCRVVSFDEVTACVLPPGGYLLFLDRGQLHRTEEQAEADCEARNRAGGASVFEGG